MVAGLLRRFNSFLLGKLGIISLFPFGGQHFDAQVNGLVQGQLLGIEAEAD